MKTILTVFIFLLLTVGTLTSCSVSDNLDDAPTLATGDEPGIITEPDDDD